MIYKMHLKSFIFPLILISNSIQYNTSNKNKFKMYEDNGKSSLVFVFDTTGSMYNDLRQLREGAEMILNTALEDSDVIEDFVFVPFHDPAVGPATVTKSKDVFKSALNIVRVYGGGDCPEKSLGGILLALNVSRPRSFVYVFTDATASDHKLVGKVLDAVQRKQTQVVFVLTGHCNDLHRPQYQVYQQIAAASAGHVFSLNKTHVHNVLDFVRASIRARTVNLGAAVNPAGYNYTQAIPIDSTLGEVTVSVSGDKPSIKVVTPEGRELTGPPRLVTTLDLAEIMVVKVLNPEPGNWTITTGSAAEHSVRVVGSSQLTFTHGFSVEPPNSMAETSYRPLQGTYNHMMISLTQTDRPVHITFAEILSLEGRVLFEIPLKQVDNETTTYLANAFVPPDQFFYIAINGRDEFNQEIRRIGATAVQAKPPDVPYLTVPNKIVARSHDSVVLPCTIESLVPVTAMWTKDGVKIQPQISSLQSTTIEYVIDDMSEASVGTYRCVAKNVAGLSKAATEVVLIVDPPLITISPGNKSVQVGDNITISCIVSSEALLLKYQLVFNGTQEQYVVDINMEPNVEGVYVFNKTLQDVDEKQSGVYYCVASNRGGETIQSTNITIQSEPLAQILGPHTQIKLIHTPIQLVCHVENADRMVWMAPNNTIVEDVKVYGDHTNMYDGEATEDGAWICMAFNGRRNASDSIQITIHIKPQVEIKGPKNITILNGTAIDIECIIVAKPEPRIIWHRETERFLNNTISIVKANTYKSVLTLDSRKEIVNGTYFCFGENAEGIHQDSVVVSVRRKMTIVEGFTDISTVLYSQIQLPCNIDTYPPPFIQWYHNGTQLVLTDNMYLTENNTYLHITRVYFENLGRYSCKVNNGFEEIILEGVVTVDGLESPVIAKAQKEIIVHKGKSTLIPCRVTGNPQPTITWQFKPLHSSQYTTLPDHVIVTPDNSEVVILNVEDIHEGTFECTAQNILGVDLYELRLVVQYPPQIIKDINDIDKPLNVEAGNTVKLSCKASGNPPPVVTWRKDDQHIAYSNNIYLTEFNELVINKATEFDSGVFTCNVSSELGSTHKNYTIFVYDPPHITPPTQSHVEYLEGELVLVPCEATGVPLPKVTWTHNGHSVQFGRKVAGVFGLRFIANLTDFGEYTCVAANEYGNDSITYSVYIWVPPYIEPPLKVSQEVLLGSNTTLSCDAVGFPIPTMWWEYHDELVTNTSYGVSVTEGDVVTITNASSLHEGVYSCVAENVAGIATKDIYLKVNEPPKIEADNYTGPYIATDRDSELVIACRATGRPAPFVVWAKGDRFIDNDFRYNVDTDGTLTIKNPTLDLSGEYTCLAKNVVGTDNKTVLVEIYPILPPRMQADESRASQTVVEGTNMTIQCPIPIAHTDTVKWYKDAKLISTGPLIIPNVTRLNSSTYACVVSNIVGSTHSNVDVVVEWGPKFVNTGTDLEIVKGDDAYIDCETDAKPVGKVKWLFNWKPVLGKEDDRLKILDVQTHHRGMYRCTVSNVHGTVVRDASLDVLEPPFISQFDLLDVQLKEGMNATLDCRAKGWPQPNVTWIFNNTNWHFTNSSLSTTNITTQSEGLFRCEAANKVGATYIVYRVIVSAAARVEGVVTYSGGEGESVQGRVGANLSSRIRLSCIASGKPVPQIQWLRNGNVLSENQDDISYADLVFDKIEPGHSGQYSCIASNDGGMDQVEISLEVFEPPKIFMDVFQSTPGAGLTRREVIAGQSLWLHCHPYGTPAPEIYWFRDGLPLRFFDDTMVSQDYGEVIVAHSARYEQSGNYTCVARNKVGSASLVYMVDVLVPPPIPKESVKPVSTRVGKQLVLRCPAEGSPLPRVGWIKHPYSEVVDTDRIELADDNYTLIINQTQVSDSGKYSCIATNKVGTSEVVFDVTIEKPPSIAGNVGSNNVENHVVPLGRSIVLKCQADGHPAPNITWLKDTQPVASSQLVLGNNLLAVWSVSAGQYLCVAENVAGTVYRRYNLVIKVPGKWTGWSAWSLCNVTCGDGAQARTRVCQYIDDYNVTYDKSSKSEKLLVDESSCKGSATDRRKCHMPPCEIVMYTNPTNNTRGLLTPYKNSYLGKAQIARYIQMALLNEDESQSRWSSWSKWSVCSSSCGRGMQTRTRTCKSRVACPGDNVQIRKCPGLPKCSNDASNNDVYSSREDLYTEASEFVPEMTFEMHSELISSHRSADGDVDEADIKTGSKYPPSYHLVNVTENLDHSERGPCEPGYTYNSSNGACHDIDECLIELNQCHSTQRCENSAGAYTCACDRGYVALGAGQRCLDINECEQDIHSCQFACVNSAGGYVCACPPTLRLHADRHHCVPPSSYKRRYSYEDLDSDTLTASIDFPSRYTKNRG